MHCNGLALHWRTTLMQNLLTDYLEKFIISQHHIINLHQKHDYLLEQMGNRDDIPLFFLNADGTKIGYNKHLSKQQHMTN
jgi:hypothetical protein